MRYEYPLTQDSQVIDIGAHEGKWSEEIAKRYNCWIRAYEPVREFFVKAKRRLEPFQKVSIVNAGVAPVSEKCEFGVKGDMTGLHTSDCNYREIVYLLDVSDVILTACDLVKINIEGGEYDMLEHMLRTSNGPRRLTSLCKNIQVQFHGNVPNSQERWQKIREQLLETHRITYDAPFCWENYERID